MKVTVADCLELNAFKDAQLVAGEMNTDNEVKSISVLDICDTDDFELKKCEATEVLLTGFLGCRKDIEMQCRIVREVADKGCAALVVYYTGKAVKTLDSKVISAAESKQLPLILMNESADYSKAITEVMDRVLYGDNFRNSLISNTVFHLLNFEKHSNFQSAVREAAINNDFQLIILSEDFNPVLTVETRHKATIADAIRLGRERNVEGDSKVYTMIDVNGVLTYWGPCLSCF